MTRSAMSRLAACFRSQGALALASEVAEGLSRAHDEAIVHQDFKTANIVVTEDAHAKIIALGLR